VELASFTAECISGWARLDWMTETELNNDRFDVERSTDATTYTAIGSVPGSGTTSGHHAYTFSDYSQVKRNTWYRLAQYDYSGKVRYHGPVLVKPCITKNWPGIEAAYFHNGAVTVELSSEVPVNEKARLFNLNGQLVDSRDLRAEPGRATITLGKNLPEGIYLVAIGGGDRRLVGGAPAN
jgi:hypothetical protein